MGMDLTRGNEWLPITRRGWMQVVDVAIANGWVPKGTKAPEWVHEDGTPASGYHIATMDGWDGDYHTNSGQRVEDDDASNLAHAPKLNMVLVGAAPET